MSDLAWRITILGLVVLVAAVSFWRSGRAPRGSAEPVSRPDLRVGVHLFSSATCVSCVDARRVLREAYGDGFTEIRFEDDPAGFGAYGIESVPTVFVIGTEGRGTRWEGVPPRRQLPRNP